MTPTAQKMANRSQKMSSKFNMLSLPSIAKRLRSGKAAIQAESGATMVEFALATTILFAMVFGILQLSMALYSYHFTADAAREATRWAIVRGSLSCTNTPALNKCNATTTDITNVVKSLGYPGIDPNQLTVTTTYRNPDNTLCTTAPCNLPGNSVQVRVSYAFLLQIPFSTSPLLHLGSTSMMTISQ